MNPVRYERIYEDYIRTDLYTPTHKVRKRGYAWDRKDAIVNHSNFVTTPRPCKVPASDEEGQQIAITGKYLRGTLPEQNLRPDRHVLRV